MVQRSRSRRGIEFRPIGPLSGWVRGAAQGQIVPQGSRNVLGTEQAAPLKLRDHKRYDVYETVRIERRTKQKSIRHRRFKHGLQRIGDGGRAADKTLMPVLIGIVQG